MVISFLLFFLADLVNMFQTQTLGISFFVRETPLEEKRSLNVQFAITRQNNSPML